MGAETMKPYALAILDYHRGNHSAVFEICREDGLISPVPVSTFFRDAEEYEIEKIALGLCKGNILDVGAGTGIHTLFLQEKGFSVCALDVQIEVVQIMKERGCNQCLQWRCSILYQWTI